MKKSEFNTREILEYNEFRERKRVSVQAEPLSDELNSVAKELYTIYASDGKVYGERLPEMFIPPIAKNSNETYSSDFIRIYGSPSIYHPVCCSVKSSL